MRVRLIRSTPFKGKDHYVGDVLDVSPVEAKTLVDSYRAAVYVDESVQAPVRGMTVHEDPVIESRDPIPPKRRSRKG